jgi:hypothetical protein
MISQVNHRSRNSTLDERSANSPSKIAYTVMLDGDAPDGTTLANIRPGEDQ